MSGSRSSPRRETKLRELWLEAVDDGDGTRERLTFETLRDLTDEQDRLEGRLSGAHEALSGLAQPTPVDTLLDFYNGLSEAVRGRLERSELGDVNSGLRELFECFVLDTKSGGIEVLPHFKPEVPRVVVTFHGEHLDEDVVVVFPRPGQDEKSLEEKLLHWNMLHWNDNQVISTLATGDERIVPPVKRLMGPEQKGTNAQEFDHFFPRLLALPVVTAADRPREGTRR